MWDETRNQLQYCLFLNAPRGTRADEMKRYCLVENMRAGSRLTPEDGSPTLTRYGRSFLAPKLQFGHALAEENSVSPRLHRHRPYAASARVTTSAVFARSSGVWARERKPASNWLGAK